MEEITNERLNLDNVDMKDMSKYLSLTNYFKDFKREEVELFYLDKKEELDLKLKIEHDIKIKYKDDTFINNLKYFYELGFGPGTKIKFFTSNSNIFLTGKVKKIKWPDVYDIYFEYYDDSLGEEKKYFIKIHKDLTFIKEYNCIKSNKNFEEVLFSMNEKCYQF